MLKNFIDLGTAVKQLRSTYIYTPVSLFNTIKSFCSHCPTTIKFLYPAIQEISYSKEILLYSIKESVFIKKVISVLDPIIILRVSSKIHA